MKKILAVLWAIIIIGSAFIAINIFRPDTIDIKGKISNLTSPNKTEENNINKEKPSQSYEEYILLGDKLLSNKNYSQAIQNYIYAVKLNQDNVTPYIKLGEAYLKNNEPPKAYDTFLKGLEIAPDSIRIQTGIVQSFLNIRQFEKARDYLLTLDLTQPEIKYYNAIILILFKEFEKAQLIFTEITSAKEKPNTEIVENSQKFLTKFRTFSSFKEGDPLFLQTLMAKALTEVGQYDAAVPLLYDVINQKPNYRDPWIILGYAYLKTDKIGDAIDAFSNAETKFPDKPETLFFLGISYFANDNLERAVYYIEEADKKGFEPKDLIDMKLGDLYMQQGKHENSAQKYDDVLTVNTTNIDVFHRAIWLYLEKLNNPVRALELAQKAVESFPNNAMSYNLLGWTYTASNNFVKAKDNLQKAIELDPNLDAAYLNIGILCEKQNLTDLAEEYYQKAVTLGQGTSVGNLAKVKLKNLTNKPS